MDISAKFSAYVCRYENCILPVSPALKLPVTSRPADALYWSNLTTWTTIALHSGYVYTSTNGINPFPSLNDSVRVPIGLYLVVDTAIPQLKYLEIEGILEFDNNLSHNLTCEIIFIDGGQMIVGWENNPILTDVTITVTGKKAEAFTYTLPNEIDPLGYKAIGVYGGLDIHGMPRNVTWTTLASSMGVGSKQVTLVDAVDWKVNEQIVVTTTTYSPTQNEVFTISGVSVDKKTLNLTQVSLYKHLSFSEKISNTQTQRIAAAVGLLTRNVKIIGSYYDLRDTDLYGFTIKVTDYSHYNSDGILMYYKGYARLSNVEFAYGGQFSRLDGDDRGFTILISNLGAYNYNRPTYVRSCAFHHNYFAALGILGSSSIPFEKNVVYRTLEYSLYLEGDSNIIRNNLVSMNHWASTFIQWEAPFDRTYWGAVDAHMADSVVIENNFIAGAERTGLLYKGGLCAGASIGVGMNHSIKNNTIHGALGGVTVFPDYSYGQLSCVSVSTFTIFKCAHFGIYYQNPQSVIADANVYIDNQVNVYLKVIEPSPLDHTLSQKTSQVTNSLFIGRSSTFDCDYDQKPSDFNFLNADTITAYGAGHDDKGMVGVSWANFIASANMAPIKPW